MSDVQGQIIEVAHDLLAIEVNTIVKPNMTATRMRNVAHTLLDIISEYDATILLHEPTAKRDDAGSPSPANEIASAKASTDTQPDPKSQPPAEGKKLSPPLHDLDAEIESLSDRARKAIKRWKQPPASAAESLEAETELYVLNRIRDNCDTIRGLFDSLAQRSSDGKASLRGVSRQNATMRDIALTTNERLQLRKIWEVGTERVMMQTVIHLNGDVFTRISRQVADGGPDSTTLLGIHNRGVSMAVDFWGKLSDIVVGMFKTLFEKLKL